MDDSVEDYLVRKAGPVVSLLRDEPGWAPAVPHDLDAARPEISEAGTAECTACGTELALAKLMITGDGYACDACTRSAALANGPALDQANVKVGRGRWWLMPLVIAVASVPVILWPGVALGACVVVGVTMFWIGPAIGRAITRSSAHRS